MFLALASTLALAIRPSDLQAPRTGAQSPHASAVLTPGPRRWPALAYDEARARVVLFGGEGNAAPEPTWTWDGHAWTEHSIPGPSPRHESAAAFDVARGRVVMYGGRVGDFPARTVFDETWQLDGRAWSQSSAQQPGSRVHFAYAYDRRRERFVVVGGVDVATGSDLTDVWEWDGAAWARSQVAAPINLFAPHMAFDAELKTLVLMSNRPSNLMIRTWTFDGTAFTPIGANGPALVASGQAFTTLGPSGGLLLFGGVSAGTLVSETWTWRAGTWTRVDAPGPPARRSPAVVYDRARDRVLLYGGGDLQTTLGDFWEFASGAWKELR